MDYEFNSYKQLSNINIKHNSALDDYLPNFGIFSSILNHLFILEEKKNALIGNTYVNEKSTLMRILLCLCIDNLYQCKFKEGAEVLNGEKVYINGRYILLQGQSQNFQNFRFFSINSEKNHGRYRHK